MMLLLILDVAPKIVQVRWAEREDSVPALPMEVRQGVVLGLDPLRRLSLDLRDEIEKTT